MAEYSMMWTAEPGEILRQAHGQHPVVAIVGLIRVFMKPIKA